MKDLSVQKVVGVLRKHRPLLGKFYAQALYLGEVGVRQSSGGCERLERLADLLPRDGILSELVYRPSDGWTLLCRSES